MTTESYVDHLLADLKDSDRAGAYLSVCLEDEDPRVFALALRDVTESWGGVAALAGSSTVQPIAPPKRAGRKAA